MTGTSEAVSVRVLDREYTVGVAPDERDSLMAAARLLDARMREIRGANRMAAVDRVAILAALNIADEYFQLRDIQSAVTNDIETRTNALISMLEEGIIGDYLKKAGQGENRIGMRD